MSAVETVVYCTWATVQWVDQIRQKLSLSMKQSDADANKNITIERDEETLPWMVPVTNLLPFSSFSNTKTINCLDIVTNVQIIWGTGLILTRQNNQ